MLRRYGDVRLRGLLFGLCELKIGLFEPQAAFAGLFVTGLRRQIGARGGLSFEEFCAR